MIEETYAYGLVLGCSLFGVLWGLVNTLMVSNVVQKQRLHRCYSLRVNLVPCRSEKLIWKIIPILEAKREMMSRNLSLITKT